ncbi:hypothetical protein JCM3766R1_005439 [Sporobolomyces carnicolor]
MAPPPLAHPLPPRPGGAYQPPTSSNRPPSAQFSTPTPLTPATSTPLSLPNRPNAAPPLSSTLPSRPPLGSSTSSFFGASVASPRLSASSASSQTGKEYPSSGTGPSGLVAGELPWPRVRDKLAPDEARVNSELIELGPGWSVKYKCWKGAAIAVSGASSQPRPPSTINPSDYDPFVPAGPPASQIAPPSSSHHASFAKVTPEKEQEGPPRKKPRPTLIASDSLSAVEDLGTLGPPLSGGTAGLSLPPTPLAHYNQPSIRTDASTSKLEDQVRILRASDIAQGLDLDPFERARKDLIRRGKQKCDEGGDRLDFMSLVKVSGAQLGTTGAKAADEDAKGKGKEKAVEDKVEAVGRTLWAFALVRGGDTEATQAPFEDLEYEGLECELCSNSTLLTSAVWARLMVETLMTGIASGSFDHSTLYPALYPPSSTMNTSNAGGTSPLNRSAQNYPSALALSAVFLSSSSYRSTPLAVAHQLFLAAVEDSLMAEIVCSTPVQSGSTKWQRLGHSLVLLPPACAFAPLNDLPAPNQPISPTSPRKKSEPPSTRTTFQTTLQRSTILVQTRLEEVLYRPVPPDSELSSASAKNLPVGYPILLAPLGVKARLIRRMYLRHADEALTNKWRNQLAGSQLDVGGRDWLIVRLDLSDSNQTEHGIIADGDGEVVWPTELVVLDGSRPLPCPSPESSPEKGTPSGLPSDDLHEHNEHERATNDASVTSPDAKFPPAPFTTPDLSSLERSPHAASSTTPRERAGALLPSPYDSSARRRYAAKTLARAGRQRLVATEDSDEAATLEHGALSRRTNEVWRWMEDETARKAREAAEKLSREQKEKEEEEERKTLEEAEKGKKAPAAGAATGKASQPPPPPTAAAAAPINMRTPMSLGTSSTEAPSPADAAYPLHGHSVSTATSAHQNHLTTPTATNATTTTAAGGLTGAKSESDTVEVDGLGLGLYPSPEEPPRRAPASLATATGTSQPMSSLDNAFASFDWGDGSFGTSGGAGPGGAIAGAGMGTAMQDYDDGMDLLGLTDDDFSFFDTAPTPLAGGGGPSIAPAPNDLSHDPFSLPLPTTASPKFTDHFAHLSNVAAPFVSSASPPSPYSVQTSPHFAVQTSPLATTANHFPFDHHHSNALGLSHAVLPSPIDPAAPLEQEEFLAVAGPDSSALEASDLAAPSFSVDLAKRAGCIKLPPSQSFPTRPLAYDPILFAPSYGISATKYQRKVGKFGLPTPESDNDGDTEPNIDVLESAEFNLSSDSVLPRVNPTSLEPWYVGICDPRRGVAERLQRDRKSKQRRARGSTRGTSSGSQRLSEHGTTSLGVRRWKRALVYTDETSDGTITPDEDSGEGSEMELDEIGCDDGLTRKGFNDPPEAAIHSALTSTGGGIDLLRIGEYVSYLVGRHAPTKLASNPLTLSALASLESLLILLVEQTLVHPESRTLFPTTCVRKSPRVLSTGSILSISTSLATVCSNFSLSPLFADHTHLPGLEVATSPALVLRSQQSMLQVSTAAVKFWKPMGFEPVAGRKNVTVFALYEEGDQALHDSVEKWLRAMAATYQGLRLGEQSLGHSPASSQFGGTQNGHLPLPVGALARGLSKEDSKALSIAVSDISKTYSNVVVYIFAPVDMGGRFEPFSTSSPLFTLAHLLQRCRSPNASMITCPVPLPRVHGDVVVTLDSQTKSAPLEAYALSVYDQLLLPVSRLRFPVPDTFPSASVAPNPASQTPSVRLYQSPAVKISPLRPRKIGFDMNFPVSTLAVQQRHRFLHVCYTAKPALEDGTADWIHLASIDDTGETWRTVNRQMKTAPGAAGDVLRARLVWSCIVQLLASVDVEWRIVICRLGEPSIVEIRAWDSMLKDQLSGGIRRPLHATFLYVELNPPLCIRPSNRERRRPSVQSDTISEEGELSFMSRGDPSSAATAARTEPLFDTEPTILSFTPSEPVNVLPKLNLFAPASSYIIHVSRIPTFTHALASESTRHSPMFHCDSSPSPITVYGIHFLLSHASRSSSYTSATLDDLARDVRQSFAELGALARVRWQMSGRLPWHLEAVKLASELADSISQASSL